jgi:hypothetical protein
VTAALDRFRVKCRFETATGCVIWTGGTTACRAGTDRTGVFWDAGRKHLARRWAAENIHNIDLMGKETDVTCGNELCVEHVMAQVPLYPHRQFQVLRDLGYCDYDERTKIEHNGVKYDPPEWLNGEKQ